MVYEIKLKNTSDLKEEIMSWKTETNSDAVISENHDHILINFSSQKDYDAFSLMVIPDALYDYRHMTLLNGHGDLQIEWNSKDDSLVRKIIEEKMKSGVKFFIKKPNRFISIFNKNTSIGSKKQLQNLNEVKSRKIIVEDSDLAELLTSSSVTLSRSSNGNINIEMKLASSVDEVVKNPSVGVKQFSGG